MTIDPPLIAYKKIVSNAGSLPTFSGYYNMYKEIANAKGNFRRNAPSRTTHAGALAATITTR